MNDPALEVTVAKEIILNIDGMKCDNEIVISFENCKIKLWKMYVNQNIIKITEID